MRLVSGATSNKFIAKSSLNELFRGRLDSVESCVHILFCVFFVFFFFFFFLLPAYADFGGQKLLFCTVVVLFIYCSNIVYTLKNIKNGSHDTFHTFKNYFATVFSVSATISSIQTDPLPLQPP